MKKFSNTKYSSIKQISGFTLIELLIVIAVLGVLATVVLVDINPAEQFAKARDAGRKSTVAQLANAVQAYSISYNGYLSSTNSWITNLKNAGEISSIPTLVKYTVTTHITGYSTGCTAVENPDSDGGVQNGWCYFTAPDPPIPAATSALVVVLMESGAEASKCATGLLAWWIWQNTVSTNQTGLVCSVTQPNSALTVYTITAAY